MAVRLKKLAFDGLPISPSPFHYYTQLTARERRGVDVYVATLDMRDAARAAGFSDLEGTVKGWLRNERFMCAVRERLDAVSDMAGLTATDLRRDLKQVFEADATELSGIHKVPCRHCYGMNGQFQYTDSELYYVEQAHSYGEEKWPFSCVTHEFGDELYRHAQAAWVAGKNGRALFLKGGGGYTRTREINSDCPQCHGDGTPMAYICDTRNLSDAGKKILRGIRIGDNRFEVLSIDRAHVREMLARDLRVGVERKEMVLTLPRTPEEFRTALEKMPTRDLEEFVQRVVTLGESEYETMSADGLPAPVKMTRGN